MKAHEALTVFTVDGESDVFFLPLGAAVDHLSHHVMTVQDTAGERHTWNFRNVISYHMKPVPEAPEEGN